MDGVVTQGIDVVDQDLRGVADIRVDLGAADAQATAQAIEVGDREAQRGGERLGAVRVAGVLAAEVAVIRARERRVVADADAVVGQNGL
jgi:hypothetical protein